MGANEVPAEAPAQPGNEGSNAEHVHRNKFVAFASKFLRYILEQWLIIGFGLSCLFGYLWPNVAATDGVIRSQYSILYGGVAVIFLISGLQLPPKKLRQNVFNWRLHILTQGISFVLIPLLWLAIMWIIIAAGDLHTNVVEIPILLGMLVTSCLPTTIASNVVMTRNAGGDDAAAIIEVVLGNVFGSFLCPLLIYAYIPNRPEFQIWTPASLDGLSKMYQHVGMQLGLSVLIPMGVGQTIRILFEEKVMWCLAKFYMAKISTFFLCTLAWVTFSNAFKTGAIYQIPKGSIIFNIVMNIVLYGVYTVICFALSRPPRRLVAAFETRAMEKYVPRCVRRIVAPKHMSREQAVAVCFCGAAKTQAVGIPLVSAMWADKDELTRFSMTFPVLLYTMEQVFLAQVLVYVFRWYLKRDEAHKTSLDLERAPPGPVDEVERAGERPEGQSKPADNEKRPEQHGHVSLG